MENRLVAHAGLVELVPVKLLLDRDPPDKTCTIGHLWVDGEPFCDTLEPLKPIPAGTYLITLTVSGKAMRGELWTPRLDYKLPELEDVPGHTEIRLHAGNDANDTEDCILVGTWTGGEDINGSRVVLASLIDMIAAALGNEQPVSIQIDAPLV